MTSTSGPQWTGIVLFRLALTLSGTIAISETADVTLQLVDTTAGTALPLLTGSGFDGTVLTRSAPRITSRVGAAPATYALEVPILSLRLGHAYAVRVHATDLEQQSTDLDLPFKLLEKWW